MSAKLITFLLILGLVAGLALFNNQSTNPELSDKLILQRIDGTLQTLKEFKGKPLLVTFWSPSCVICMHEVNDFNQLYSELQGGTKFKMLALSMYYDRPDLVIKVSNEKNMTYPVYFDLKKLASTAFGNIIATPTSFLLNAEGKIVYKQVGPADFKLLNSKLKQLIG